MCGLAGFVNLDGAPADAGVIAAMTRTLAHRGPDDHGQSLFSLRGQPGADSALGFHRLSILDLSPSGHQPMATSDGSVLIAFNGEVYNAFEYRQELETAGFRFRSRTDTEVLLYLYERYGIAGLLDRLNGMFAIAIADLRAHTLHVARDHFGIKPLYWTQAGTTVMFASEAKAFLPHPSFTPRIDSHSVDEQLAFRYVAGEATLLENVRQLRPGHRLAISPDGVVLSRYWALPAPKRPETVHGVGGVDQLDALMRHSVRAQLLSDVKVGCQLSGGIDSSLVTLLARQEGASADAFSVVFEDAKFSEDPWITDAAAVAGVDAHRLLFTEDSFLGPLEDATWHMDQPISHANSLGIWMLAQHARQSGVTVLLSGEGADEVFAGYSRFQKALQQSPEAFILSTLFQPPSKLARLRPGSNLDAVLERRLALFNEANDDPLSNALQYEMQTFLVDLLIRQDKMTMAHGVENRVPFLDRNVVAFARDLHAEQLLGPLRPKAVVKDVAKNYFSDAFTERPKAAFNLPLSQYFRSARFVAIMEEQLLPGMRQRGLVDAVAVRTLWKRSLSAPALTEVLLIPVALEVWAQQFLDRRRNYDNA